MNKALETLAALNNSLNAFLTKHSKPLDEFIIRLLNGRLSFLSDSQALAIIYDLVAIFLLLIVILTNSPIDFLLLVVSYLLVYLAVNKTVA